MADLPTYLSADGLEKLEQELEHRVKVVRPEISSRIADAREMGDLSENFAYHDARDQQGINESRILALQGMIRTAVVVANDAGSVISLGSTFEVQSATGNKTFTLVGENEADPLSGKISNLSPLGAAFLHKKAGDEVVVNVPSGELVYTILSVN